MLVVRAIGPSLGTSGVPGALADPTLEVYNSNGDLLRSNDNYEDSPNVSTVRQFGLAPTNSFESAIFFEGAPGNYTAVMRGVGGTSGVGLVEVYGIN